MSREQNWEKNFFLDSGQQVTGFLAETFSPKIQYSFLRVQKTIWAKLFSPEVQKNSYFYGVLVKTFRGLIDRIRQSCQKLIPRVQGICSGKNYYEIFQNKTIGFGVYRNFPGFLAEKTRQGCQSSCSLRIHKNFWRIKGFLWKKLISKTIVRLTIQFRDGLSKVHSTCPEQQFQRKHNFSFKKIFVVFAITFRYFGKKISQNWRNCILLVQKNILSTSVHCL